MGSRVPREEEEDAVFEGAGWQTSTTPPGQLTGPFEEQATVTTLQENTAATPEAPQHPTGMVPLSCLKE